MILKPKCVRPLLGLAPQHLERLKLILQTEREIVTRQSNLLDYYRGSVSQNRSLERLLNDLEQQRLNGLHRIRLLCSACEDAASRLATNSTPDLQETQTGLTVKLTASGE